MATVHAKNKYSLRSLHEEIALFDRKLAHLLKYDTFASDKERDTAASKMAAKRELLVRTARQMAEEGIEFKPSELPLSLRTGEVPSEEHADAAPEESAAVSAANPMERPTEAAYDGSVLNFRREMKEYMEKRKKAYVPSVSA